MDLWVFGYGSLMWRPGFEYEEAVRARLDGYSRSFCVYSVHHRGTEKRPGLVLGLDRGGVCHGLAFRIAPRNVRATIDYLNAREQVNGVYRAAYKPAVLAGAELRRVSVLAYLVERAHPSYVAGLPLTAQARVIRGAHGLSGDNVSYVVNTLDHLAQMNIREPRLERLRTLLGPVISRDRELRDEARRHIVWRGRGITPAQLAVRRLRPDQRRRFIYRME